MKKKKNPIRVYLILIIILIIVSIALTSIVLINKNKKNIYKAKTFNLTYDNNWVSSKNKESDTSVTLVHRSGSTFNVEISYLENKYRKEDLDVLIKEILNGIEKENTNYKLVNKEKSFTSKNKYESYKYLYETNNYQVLIEIGKISDKLFVLTYSANDKYFDIILDSIKEIIWNLEIYI